jgi:hypothetical protein
VAGIVFFVRAAFLAELIQWRMLVQSLILLILGVGGTWLSLKKER